MTISLICQGKCTNCKSILIFHCLQLIFVYFRVCSTLSRISDDWTLWKDVRFDKYDKSMEDVYINYLKESTTNMSIRGDDNPSYNTSISHKFIIQLETKCPELTVLSLTKQKIDASEVRIFFSTKQNN